MYNRQKSVDTGDLYQLLNSSTAHNVGNYIIGRNIGEGSFGKVKLATHTLTGIQVAVKIVDKIHAPAVIREVETWRHLNHPNIAQLYEVLTTETKIYMVTEWVSGGEVFDYVVQSGRLDDTGPDVRRIFRQIVSAIGYCHDKNFVHRDLKLENILMTDDLQIKVIDFGFTREYNERKLLDTYCGSVAYAAPEMISGKKYSGPHADVWSLGVILFTLLSGYLPFDDDNDANIHKKILNRDFEMPNFLSDVSKDLINKILKLEASDRITIPSILSHPWFSGFPEDETALVKLSTPLGNSPEELALAQQLMESGFEVSNILASVRSYACDSASALWYLLLKKNRNSGASESLYLESEPASPSTIPVSFSRMNNNSPILQPNDLERLATQGANQRRKSSDSTTNMEACTKLLASSTCTTSRRGMMMKVMKTTAPFSPPSSASTNNGVSRSIRSSKDSNTSGLASATESPRITKAKGAVIEEDEPEEVSLSISSHNRGASSPAVSVHSWDGDSRTRTESVLSNTSDESGTFPNNMSKTPLPHVHARQYSAKRRGNRGGGLKARYGQRVLTDIITHEEHDTQNNVSWETEDE